MVGSFSRETVFHAFTANGKAQTNETAIRKLANSKGVKAINPFLIRMYELPQIRVSNESSSQFCVLWYDEDNAK